MPEHGLIFCAEMITALLSGRKTAHLRAYTALWKALHGKCSPNQWVQVLEWGEPR